MICLQVLFTSDEIFLSKIKLGNKFLFGVYEFSGVQQQSL